MTNFFAQIVAQQGMLAYMTWWFAMGLTLSWLTVTLCEAGVSWCAHVAAQCVSHRLTGMLAHENPQILHLSSEQ